MVTVIQGNCLERLRGMAPRSVHVIITSPPYWGLRDYGVPPSIWPRIDADPEKICEHEWGDNIRVNLRGIVGDKSTIDGDQDRSGNRPQSLEQGAFCTRCGAWRGVFGLEPTPELYVEHARMIFREAKRVLRDDGTLWLNLGDSYASGANNVGDCPGGGPQGRAFRDKCWGKHGQIGLPQMTQPNRMPIPGLKPGDLVGIPWRVAFALQSDGWYLRRDNIWAKPNPMPESVNGWRWEKHRSKVAPSCRYDAGRQAGRASVGNPQGASLTRAGREGVEEAAAAEYEDCPGCEKCTPYGGLVLRKANWRCTTSHEYVFQLSKSDSYFCNAEEAREQSAERPSGNKTRFIAKQDGERSRVNNHLGSSIPYQPDASGRNRRSVWEITTIPYSGAHFATFPPNLVKPIILAATPVRCCRQCKAPHAPVVIRGEPRREQQLACGADDNGEYHPTGNGKFFDGTRAENARTVKQRILAGMVEKRVVDHRATCKCQVNGGGAPAVVLDIFGGSGTVGQVATELGRDAILIELNTDYIKLIDERCATTPGLAFV